MDETTWSVGAVAERLRVAAPTLRTWERRYALGPSHRTTGGHRRYTEDDVLRLQYMRRLLAQGIVPRDAARLAVEARPDAVRVALGVGTPDDDHLTPDEVVEALLDATRALDAARQRALVATVLRRDGAVAAWDHVVVPILVRVGDGWADGVIPVAAEHLVSESVRVELRSHAHRQAPAITDRAAVVVASAEEDQHDLPGAAVEAALAERGVGILALGSRVPWFSLRTVLERIEPSAAFVWSTVPVADTGFVAMLDELGGSVPILVGGPGWSDADATFGGRTAHVTSLGDAVDALERLATTGA